MLPDPHPPQACFKSFRVSPVLLNRPWEVLWGPTSACPHCRIQLFPFSLSSPCSGLPGSSPVLTCSLLPQDLCMCCSPCPDVPPSSLSLHILVQPSLLWPLDLPAMPRQWHSSLCCENVSHLHFTWICVVWELIPASLIGLWALWGQTWGLFLLSILFPVLIIILVTQKALNH